MMQLLIKYGNIALTTTTMHRVRYHLYLLFLVRLGGYTVNLSDFYSYICYRETDRFFAVSGVPVAEAAAFRINLNLDGATSASKSHTHP